MFLSFFDPSKKKGIADRAIFLSIPSQSRSANKFPRESSLQGAAVTHSHSVFMYVCAAW